MSEKGIREAYEKEEHKRMDRQNLHSACRSDDRASWRNFISAVRFGSGSVQCLCTGPNDLVAVVLSDKLHRKFSMTRLLVDGVFAAIGFLLGGTVGAGTIVCVALVGPVAGIFLPVSERLVSQIVSWFSLHPGR